MSIRSRKRTDAAPDRSTVPDRSGAHRVLAYPKLYRRRGGRLIAGVCGGIADHLDVSVLWVRAVFAVLAAFGGAGVLAYGILWVFVPQSSGAERPLSTCDIRSGAEPEQTQSEMQTKRFAVRAIRVPGAATGGMVGRSSMLCELPGGELVGEPLNGAHGDGLRVAHAAGEHSGADVGVVLDQGEIAAGDP